MTTPGQPLLTARGVSKHFGGVVALDDVSLDVFGGEVHALMGENGAGKSTLGKVLAGALPPTAARLTIDGKSVSIRNPLDAQRLGVTIIFQELDLFAHLSIAENIAIGNLRYQERFAVSYRAMDQFARPALARVGLSDLSPHRPVHSLSVAQQQLVAIARALSMNARVIVFDESTSALTDEAVERLFAVIDQLRRDGVACLYVTHKMDEVFRICDRITVLRDGRYVGTRLAKQTDMAELVRMMIGHDVRSDTHAAACATDQPLLSINNLRTARLRDVSLDVAAGEVVGLAGLVGAGRGEVGRALFGLEPILGGRMTLNGQPYQPDTPRQAMKRGVALLPRDRKAEGLMMQMSVRENASIAVLDGLSNLGWIRRRREAQQTDHVGRQTRLKAAAPQAVVSSLSGGNQQKVLIGRWLLREADLYFLDDPTRGVDIGAKEDIYAIIEDLARRGKGVIMVSSELPELLRCCDRVVVLNEGRVAADLDARRTTQEQVLTHATSTAAIHSQSQAG